MFERLQLRGVAAEINGGGGHYGGGGGGWWWGRPTSYPHSLTLPLIFMTQHYGWTDGIAAERETPENMR